MELPAAPNPERTAREFVTHWFELLAQNRWGDALALIDASSTYGAKWSESEVKKSLAAYTRDRPLVVTSPGSIPEPPRITSGQFNDGSGFWLDCAIPLNGGWSDLTAQFEFKLRGSSYAVALQDIHVL